uniref:Uncharacterized protein n=1 Tax=Bacillus cereus HuA4-10 TaxID=1053206 RepID=J7ZPE3_BACCE|nr:hypothetical protein IGC_05687 [Bacillus cereus HuA4-10]
MRQFIVTLVMCMTIVVSPYQAQASASASLPCSVIINPLNKSDKNTKGVALVYKVKLTLSFPRTNISILGVHLPNPSTLGNYDTYEGLPSFQTKLVGDSNCILLKRMMILLGRGKLTLLRQK